MNFVLLNYARSAWFHGGCMYAQQEAKRQGVVGRERMNQSEKTWRVLLARCRLVPSLSVCCCFLRWARKCRVSWWCVATMLPWYIVCAYGYPDIVQDQCAESAVAKNVVFGTGCTCPSWPARKVKSRCPLKAPSNQSSPSQRGLKLPLSATKAACL